MECQQPGGAAGPQTGRYSHVTVKEENYGEPTGGRLHQFKVKFSPEDSKKYNVDCNQPCTVLEAIQTKQKYKELNCQEKNLVIQLGKGDDYIVATHFPSSCVTRGEVLTISCVSQTVEEAKDQPATAIQSRDQYSVFYIDTVGGTNARKKKLFKNNAVKKFKYLCVYGEKGTTVEEALQRDGRFSDLVADCDFTLSDNENPKCLTEPADNVDNLNGKKFKICLPLKKRANDQTAGKQQANTGASDNPQKRRRTSLTSVRNVVHQTGISVRAAVERRYSNVDNEEIMKKLRDQFPALKEQMQSRFPHDSYQKAVELRKEDFGKIQQSFSEVHRVKKLLKLGESVCKVIVNDVTGTGFVLFDNFILTNAHLFKGCVEGERLKKGVEVSVLFNYDEPEPYTNYCCFQLAHSYIYFKEDELDYAILELNTEMVPNLKAQMQKKIPPGLLKDFGPVPESGEACLIGHPRGEVKKMDPTCIIEMEKRVQAVYDNLHPYKDSPFIVHTISHLIREQGIENIMIGGKLAEKKVAYNTFMYHGSSGSPVFDAQCKVFGLHTAGYVYGFPKTESVIEYAQPLSTILKHFVETKGNEELLKTFKKAAKGNSDLQELLESVSEAQADEAEAQVVEAEPADSENLSDSSESVDTDSEEWNRFFCKTR